MNKKILLSEEQLCNLIFEESLANIYDPYSNKNKKNKDLLNSFLYKNGKIMINIENNREYLVFFIKSISDIIGKNYVMCRVINLADYQPFGSMQVKPLDLFVEKY